MLQYGHERKHSNTAKNIFPHAKRTHTSNPIPFPVGCVTTNLSNRCILDSEVDIHFQGSPCGTWGVQSGTGVDVSSNFFFLPLPIIIPHFFYTTSISSYHCNRPQYRKPYSRSVVMDSTIYRSTKEFKLLKPTDHVMHQQFKIQQLYVLPTLYLCVLYLSENKQRLVPLTA